MQRLANSDKELYATFYNLMASGVRLPSGSKWNVLRAVTDDAMFPGYKHHIRFAVLTLDGRGLEHYGECALVLRDNMIAHRASVFEENSVLFMERHGIRVADAHMLPHGYRAIWEDRRTLCAAKLADRLEPGTERSEYPRILLQNGATGDKDTFVEVHIWGPLTARSIERVVVTEPKRKGARVILRALRERLESLGVQWETN